MAARRPQQRPHDDADFDPFTGPSRRSEPTARADDPHDLAGLRYPGRRPLTVPDYHTKWEHEDRMLRKLKGDMLAHTRGQTNVPRRSPEAYLIAAYHQYLNAVAEERNLHPRILDSVIEPDYNVDEQELVDALKRDATHRMHVEQTERGTVYRGGVAAHAHSAYENMQNAMHPERPYLRSGLPRAEAYRRAERAISGQRA